ncbi:MAG: 4-hydroxy-tetrahydrodipicolinate synthase [Clostridia bacterium]|nr:4-hydroxy-tetrahydrodipicolinate synthase [Clostridia bacterium]
MKKVIFEGAAVALVTPMYEDGSVNYDVYEKLVDFQIENGTDALVVMGTTGESVCMHNEERERLVDITVQKAKGKVPIIVGTGSNDTNYSIMRSKKAEALGADAVLCVTPYYNKTSQDGLVQHYNMIADSVDIPVILYNVPSRTGVNIKPETYYKLSKHPNIVATKEANGDISSVAKTISLCGDDLTVYSGNDDQTVPLMSLGAKGVISVFSNIMPRECHALTQAMLNSDIREGSRLQLKYLELMNALFMDVNPIPVKAAMNLLGYNCGNCRMPLVPMADGELEKLKNCMKKYGLL